LVDPDFSSQASDAEKRQIATAVLHIRARVRAAEAYREAVRPSADSAHALELRDWRGNHPGATAEILLVSAEFHLLTLAATMTARDLYPFGGFTLLRGAAEPAARAAWIMDPGISSTERRARVLVERLSALQEMRKFKNLRREADDRIQELIEDAKALGHKPVDGKWVKPEHFGQARPQATSLFSKLLPNVFEEDADAPGGRLYRILSAFAHSTLWAVLAQRELVTDYQPGLKSAMVVLNVGWLVGQLGQVEKLHSIALRRLAGQIGEGPERWDGILQGLPSPTSSGRAPTT
jgi:hypothetical protein